MKTWLFFLAIALFTFGCEPVPHYNRVQVASLTSQPNKVPIKMQGKVKPYGTIKLFQNKQEVNVPYEVIGIMSVQGVRGDEAKFMTAFMYRAADLGADAVVLDPLNLPPTQKIGYYRAEAIRFKPVNQ